MVRRSVLKDGAGVRWDGGDLSLLFAFNPSPAPDGARDAVTGAPVETTAPNHLYLLPPRI